MRRRSRYCSVDVGSADSIHPQLAVATLQSPNRPAIDLGEARHFNSGSAITSVVTVTARTGTRENGSPEISAIIVPSDTPGFTAEAAYDKLGWHASDTHPLSFSDCRVPIDHLLGQRGRGYAQFLSTLDDGSVAIAALAVGQTSQHEPVASFSSVADTQVSGVLMPNRGLTSGSLVSNGTSARLASTASHEDGRSKGRRPAICVESKKASHDGLVPGAEVR